jgi:drug/metabolite transporter (DMT)-like permease
MILLTVLLIIFLTTAGQILLKVGADRSKESAFTNRYALSGYTLFILTVILSYYLMQIIPMKYFTVIMSLNYIAVMFAARLFIHEKINQDRVIGTVLVALGVFIFLI